MLPHLSQVNAIMYSAGCLGGLCGHAQSSVIMVPEDAAKPPDQCDPSGGFADLLFAGEGAYDFPPSGECLLVGSMVVEAGGCFPLFPA